MRIVCQKCGAAYAIDDKLVTAKGVRAQCPRCKTLQLVKLPEAPAPAPAAAAPSQTARLPAVAPQRPAAPPYPAAAAFPPPPPYPTGLGPAGVAELVPPPPPPPSFSPPAPLGAPFDFSALEPPSQPTVQPFDFATLGLPPPPGSTQPPAFNFEALSPPPKPGGGALGQAGSQQRLAPLASAPPLFDLSSLPPAPAPAASRVDPLGLDALLPQVAPPAPSLPPLPGPAVADPTCKSCGKTLSDPFDQALGICDDCRNKAHTSVAGPTADTDAGRSERVDVGTILARMSKPTAASAEAPLPPPPPPPPRTTLRTALREDAPGFTLSPGAIAGIVVGLLVVVVVGGFLWVRKPWYRRPPPTVVRASAPASRRPVEQAVAQWQLDFPELEAGGAAQASAFLAAGQKLLDRDTTQAYREAELEYQKALISDQSSDAAIAGWVLALSLGRPTIDDATARTAETLLTAAAQRTGDPAVFVAQAHFLIARKGNNPDIASFAQRGLNSRVARDKALALLALGVSKMSRNGREAAEQFEEAQRVDPSLKRTLLYRARLAELQGHLKQAAELYEERLASDADQLEAVEALARLYVDVGEVGKARKALERSRQAAPRSALVRTLLAMLQYQHLDDAAGAQQALEALAQDESLSKSERSEALTHLAAALRLQGDSDRARAVIEQALELHGESVPARLQRFLLLVDKGVATQARLDLDALRDKLGQGELARLLEGRLLIADGKYDEAHRELVAVADKEPRRVDALLLAGAAAAKAGKPSRAWEACLKRGLRADPDARPWPSLTRLYVRPVDLLRPAVGTYQALVANPKEDPNPALCEGLVAWFSGLEKDAEGHFARATSIDLANADAFAFRSYGAMRRRNLGEAGKLAARAVTMGRNSPVAHLARSLTHIAQGNLAQAKLEANRAEDIGSSMLGPKVVLADIEVRQKDPAEALTLLTTVLLQDADFREAKRLLYKAGL